MGQVPLKGKRLVGSPNEPNRSSKVKNARLWSEQERRVHACFPESAG